MNLSTELLTYLKKKIPDFQKTIKKGHHLFTCPNLEQHKYKGKDPTATFIPGSDKINCLQCNWKGTVFDAIRVVERDRDLTDAQILDTLNKSGKVELFPEFNQYEKYKWFLFTIAKNGKKPIKDEHWRENEFNFKDKNKWLSWLSNGYNLAVNCEKSNVMIIDVDTKKLETLSEEQKKQRTDIIDLLKKTKTLIQNSWSGGQHYVFVLDKEIPQKVNIAGLKIDTRTDEGYFVVAPSKINDSSYNWFNLGTEILLLPESLKIKILELINKPKSNIVKLSKEINKIIDNPIELKDNNLEGCCNDTFIRLGGALLKMGIVIDKVKGILYYINKNWLKIPMPKHAVEAMVNSLDGYKESEEQTQENAVYDCAKLVQTDISAKDIMEHAGLKRAIVDKYLAKLFKEGKLVRKGRGRYDLKQRVEWTHGENEKATEYKYKMPYFDNTAYFHSGDILIIGGKTGEGKTHIAMNFIKQLKEQGVIPYLISLESGSRHEKISKKLGLNKEDYFVSKEPIDNPLQIEIEPNSFTIIDWLYTGEDFAATQSIFKHLSDEMRRKGGILLVFTQLKEDYNYFAVNLIKSFARWASRFIYDDTTGITSHFQVDKITDPKGHYQTTIIPCEFNFDSKELKKKDII